MSASKSDEEQRRNREEFRRNTREIIALIKKEIEAKMVLLSLQVGRVDPLGRAVGPDPTMKAQERKEWTWWQELITEYPHFVTLGAKLFPYVYPQPCLQKPEVLHAARMADSPAEMIRMVQGAIGGRSGEEIGDLYYRMVRDRYPEMTAKQHTEWGRRSDAWLKEHL